jgi:hypothetical protein
LRSAARGSQEFRRAAQIAVLALALTAIIVGALGHSWIALALLIAATGYAYDLYRQRDSAALQMPLTTVGQQALALSSVFAVLLIVGLR